MGRGVEAKREKRTETPDLSSSSFPTLSLSLSVLCPPSPSLSSERYFSLGTVVGKNGGGDPSVLGVAYVNVRRR